MVFREDLRGILKTGSRWLARLLVAPLFRRLEPHVKIRFTPMYTARISHMVQDTYLYLAQRQQEGPEAGIRRWFFGCSPCNRTIFNVWKRYLPIIESRLFTAFYAYTEDILSTVPAFQRLSREFGSDRISNTFQLMDRMEPRLTLSRDEERQGRRLLEEMKIGKDDWFVCFGARQFNPAVFERAGKGAPRAHGLSRIETYMDAAKKVTEAGGVAIRIGHGVTKRIPETGNPRIVDYAMDFRSDVGDIYLLAHCRFALMSQTGMSIIPTTFGVPVAMPNQIPPIPLPNGRSSLFAPKLLIDRRSRELKPFRALFDLIEPLESYYESIDAWSKIETYENDTHEIVDNSSEEIRDLCLDMLDRLDGRPADPFALELQNVFHDRFLSPLADIRAFGPRIGPRFVKRHERLLR